MLKKYIIYLLVILVVALMGLGGALIYLVVDKGDKITRNSLNIEKQREVKKTVTQKQDDGAIDVLHKADNFSGTYLYNTAYPDGNASGRLSVLQNSDSEIIFSLDVMIPRGNLGTISKAKAVLNNNRAIYEKKNEFGDKPCKFEIIFDSDRATIKEVEGGSSYAPVCEDFGAEVGAGGVYLRIASGAPDLFELKKQDIVPIQADDNNKTAVGAVNDGSLSVEKK